MRILGTIEALPNAFNCLEAAKSSIMDRGRVAPRPPRLSHAYTASLVKGCEALIPAASASALAVMATSAIGLMIGWNTQPLIPMEYRMVGIRYSKIIPGRDWAMLFNGAKKFTINAYRSKCIWITTSQPISTTEAMGSMESNHSFTKSGITESCLKKVNFPYRFMINAVNSPATIATNMPPAPNAENWYT